MNNISDKKQGPNFLLFMPETIRADFIFGAPGLKAITPNFDGLMAEGTSFTNFFSQSPFCTPSRCSMFTGRYLHVDAHRSLLHLLRKHERNLFMDLKEAGYETICFGKNDLVAGQAIGMSFSETDLRVKPEKSNWQPPVYEKGHKHYDSFYLGKRDKSAAHDNDWACVKSAIDYLDQEQEKPFCLFLPLSFAHPPYVVEEPYFSLHSRENVKPPVPASFHNKSKVHELWFNARNLEKLTPEDLIEIRATYQGMIARTDYLFGMLMDKLKESGKLENTVVIFFSDHGDYAGDYGMVEKINANFDDCLLNIPLVIRVPGQSKNLIRNSFVEGVDIYATVMELAGIEPQHQHFGKSIVKLLDSETEDQHKDMVFAEAGSSKNEQQSSTPLEHVIGTKYEDLVRELHKHKGVPGRRVMVRTAQWKYVYSPSGYEELYDLEKDPAEKFNLADKGYPEIKEELSDLILHWLVKTSDAVPFKHDERQFVW